MNDRFKTTNDCFNTTNRTIAWQMNKRFKTTNATIVSTQWMIVSTRWMIVSTQWTIVSKQRTERSLTKKEWNGMIVLTQRNGMEWSFYHNGMERTGSQTASERKINGIWTGMVRQWPFCCTGYKWELFIDAYCKSFHCSYGVVVLCAQPSTHQVFPPESPPGFSLEFAIQVVGGHGYAHGDFRSSSHNLHGRKLLQIG